MASPPAVLFVCLGNICRSPMAEAVFAHAVQQQDADKQGDALEFSTIDSCGTAAYHEQAPPDGRTLAVLKKHGIAGYAHRARKIQNADFEKFDYIFAMDAENLADLEYARARVAGKRGSADGLATVSLFGAFGGKGAEPVVDPYYGAARGFDVAYEQMVRFSRGFLAHLREAGSTPTKLS